MYMRIDLPGHGQLTAVPPGTAMEQISRIWATDLPPPAPQRVGQMVPAAGAAFPMGIVESDVGDGPVLQTQIPSAPAVGPGAGVVGVGQASQTQTPTLQTETRNSPPMVGVVASDSGVDHASQTSLGKAPEGGIKRTLSEFLADRRNVTNVSTTAPSSDPVNAVPKRKPLPTKTSQRQQGVAALPQPGIRNNKNVTGPGRPLQATEPSEPTFKRARPASLTSIDVRNDNMLSVPPTAVSGATANKASSSNSQAADNYAKVHTKLFSGLAARGLDLSITPSMKQKQQQKAAKLAKMATIEPPYLHNQEYAYVSKRLGQQEQKGRAKHKKLKKKAVDEDLWVVERILAVRQASDDVNDEPLHPGDLAGSKVEKEYLIKWDGYGHDRNTWEPEEHIGPYVVKTFWARRERAKRRVRMAFAVILLVVKLRRRVERPIKMETT
ncbi:uncharacterized protein EV422DRAFT_388912 [Fimicolochytrium jonesii]|uniref:uncharacterized protein n=1 Tax=Fimicolochytrium jonesii TaxID=1396493 RepID=UPI0022FEC753|nr:uncharacterized protein EV422DRAFT_388912 [Fimicolochytrium jonesii]KAI8823029.1 hypothetical protein EV422DRAFT_388912 [Fimicolochytrium jonesii]